jgi:hypothetical protein
MSDLKRYHMIQECINVLRKKRKVNYFEIGVQTGFCFFKIKADKKVAIDPNFIIKPTKKLRAYVKNLYNFNNKFFELTSDDFFDQQKDYIKKIGGIDVIFVDGLHLYEQTYLDIVNALQYLNKDGVILIHDCNPLTLAASIRAYTSEEAARIAPAGWANIWNGDVWKSIAKLRSEREDLEIMVFNTDHGMGMVRPGKPEAMLHYTDEQIDALSYSDLDAEREKILNLKDPSTFWDFIKKFATNS